MKTSVPVGANTSERINRYFFGNIIRCEQISKITLKNANRLPRLKIAGAQLTGKCNARSATSRW